MSRQLALAFVLVLLVLALGVWIYSRRPPPPPPPDAVEVSTPEHSPSSPAAPSSASSSSVSSYRSGPIIVELGRLVSSEELVHPLTSPEDRSEAAWATLKGRFVCDGKPPAPMPVLKMKENDFCGKCGPRDESIVLGKSGGLANVLVWVGNDDPPVPVHPDLKEPPKDELLLRHECCRIVPRVAIIRPGRPLVLRNTDETAHAINIFGRRDWVGFAADLPAGGRTQYVFAESQPAPAGIVCKHHYWERAWILTAKTPYAAASDDGGRFAIERLPVGWVLDVRVWQEKAGWLPGKPGTGLPGTTRTEKGFRIRLKPGLNDLGDIPIKPDAFSN